MQWALRVVVGAGGGGVGGGGSRCDCLHSPDLYTTRVLRQCCVLKAHSLNINLFLDHLKISFMFIVGKKKSITTQIAPLIQPAVDYHIKQRNTENNRNKDAGTGEN